MLSKHQKDWGVDQWAAYLSNQDLPCMPRSVQALADLHETRGEHLSARELADLAAADPFLCLRLLREAEKRRSERLGHETTTPLAAVMQLGTQTFCRLLDRSPRVDAANHGLCAAEARAHRASRLASLWGSARADISPDEVALASLLSESGELLLWAFAPELPEQSAEAVRSGRIARSALAQQSLWGFRFKDLTLKCASIWHLPALITQLIRGMDNPRANLSRLCVDTIRHLDAGGIDNPALPSDLAEAKQLIPGASLSWLASQLPEVDTVAAEALAAAAAQHQPPPAT